MPVAAGPELRPSTIRWYAPDDAVTISRCSRVREIITYVGTKGPPVRQHKRVLTEALCKHLALSRRRIDTPNAQVNNIYSVDPTFCICRQSELMPTFTAITDVQDLSKLGCTFETLLLVLANYPSNKIRWRLMFQLGPTKIIIEPDDIILTEITPHLYFNHSQG